MGSTFITRWTTTGKVDEIIAAGQEKYVPLIIAGGASWVQMVRTGELSFCVISHYADAATAHKAQAGGTRAAAKQEFPLTIVSSEEGDVFASG